MTACHPGNYMCVCISMSEGRRYGMCLISGAQCQCNLFFLIHGNFDSIQLIQSASGINLEGLRADRAGLFILCWFYVGILLGLKINAAKTKTKKVLERSRTQDWTHSWQNNEKTTPQSLDQCHWPSFSLKKKKKHWGNSNVASWFSSKKVLVMCNVLSPVVAVENIAPEASHL